ncbi:hypothetical protein HII36_44880 [Nonomuraea sp. NN258]|nr:LysR substrate-binding domain-containing protein [Nonomuraea antri]NRQ38910.1 hypothetical protein [Nonomuraea antri]
MGGLLDGTADLALHTSWDTPPPPGIVLTRLHEDDLLVALPAAHPLARGDRVRLRDLAGLPWIDGTHPDCLGPVSALTAALARRRASATSATTGTAARGWWRPAWA